jgi:predicted RNA-binding protein (virulence factor B family)
MATIGAFNSLTVLKDVSFGVYLDGGDLGEILLPKKQVPANLKAGHSLSVFLYLDSDDRPIATLKRPKARLGEFAYLQVVDCNRFGAFLDWGLEKDLLVPKQEQRRPMSVSQSYLVYVKQDAGNRLVASSKIDRFLDKTPPRFKPQQEVKLIIAEETPLGRKVIINHSHWGLIFSSDLFKPLHYGQKETGFIKAVRPDGKIDVSLRAAGKECRNKLEASILEALKANDGFLPLHDKSPAKAIQTQFGESKKNFKQAIGRLYKQRLIALKENGIELL